jgi:hypothetical protein
MLPTTRARPPPLVLRSHTGVLKPM